MLQISNKIHWNRRALQPIDHLPVRTTGVLPMYQSLNNSWWGELKLLLHLSISWTLPKGAQTFWQSKSKHHCNSDCSSQHIDCLFEVESPHLPVYHWIQYTCLGTAILLVKYLKSQQRFSQTLKHNSSIRQKSVSDRKLIWSMTWV